MNQITIVFFYFMKKDIENLKSIIDQHKDFWHSQNLPQYQGGPFEDKTGGMISFEAESYDHALAIINKDPFIIHQCLDTQWVKHWLN